MNVEKKKTCSLIGKSNFMVYLMIPLLILIFVLLERNGMIHPYLDYCSLCYIFSYSWSCLMALTIHYIRISLLTYLHWIFLVGCVPYLIFRLFGVLLDCWDNRKYLVSGNSHYHHSLRSWVVLNFYSWSRFPLFCVLSQL